MGRMAIVSVNHDGFQPLRMQGGNRVDGGRFDGIANGHHGASLTLYLHVNGRFAFLATACGLIAECADIDLMLRHQARGSRQNQAAIESRLHACTGHSFKIRRGQ